MEKIIIGNIRVELLSEDIVRIEYAKGGRFFDADTFFIPDKSQYAKTAVPHTCENNVICFGEFELYIPENAKSLSGVRLEKNGKKIYSYKKLRNDGNLPPLFSTPEVFAVSDDPRITVPEGGYSESRRGEYTVTDNVQDIYLLLCNKDAKKLRRLYVELTGRPELVRLSTLGGWNSKYYAYTEEEAKQVILDYERYDYPLDVMVIDTDWRSCENGWGYDINTALFPDMKRFMDFAHAHGVEVCFNDHPEPVNGTQVFDPDEIAYREKNLTALMDMGLDIWWYDRNWGTKLISPSAGVNHETLGLYLFADITAHYYQKVWASADVYRRPVVLGNADNIFNGNYIGIYSTASHRYSVQWTGDIDSNPADLSQEVDNLIKCSNNCVMYINSDCGGHVGNPDKQDFIRWMQFGVLSPVFRPHCTKDVVRTREAWQYDDETVDIVREYNNLRYRLLPVIYKNAYASYATGEPIFKSLGFEYPTDKTACTLNDEYMLGNDMLISPIGGLYPSPVQKENFALPVKATFYDGVEPKGEPIAIAKWDTLEMVLSHTSPQKNVPVYNFSARFETKVKFDRPVHLYIKSDDGATVWVDGKKVHEDKTYHSARLFPLCQVEAGEHDVVIEYFQGGGEACCLLCMAEISQTAGKSVYLPAGEWLDVFNGSAQTGGCTVAREYALKETPLFVRLGAVIPLSYTAHNTKEQKWNRLVFDWYAHKTASDSGYLYEDDTETTAYKLGKYRTTEYKATYCEKCNAYVLDIQKAAGEFDGEKCFTEREITVKRHVLGGARAVRATVNGVQVEITRTAKNSDAFPLNTTVDAPDGECESITFTARTDQPCEVKFYL